MERLLIKRQADFFDLPTLTYGGKNTLEETCVTHGQITAGFIYMSYAGNKILFAELPSSTKSRCAQAGP